MVNLYIPDRGDIVWLDFDPQAGHETAPSGSGSVKQTMLQNVKVTGDIDLGDLTQEA